MNELILTYACDSCDSEMKNVILCLDSEPGKVKYEISFLAQTQFTCPECGLVHIVGDIEIYNETDFG